MLLLYVRHGDPIYSPDSITPLGERQAEAVGRRIARFGVDEIYSSPLRRAQMTAQPTSEILKKPIITSDVFSESRAFENFSCESEDGKWHWFWGLQEARDLFTSPEVLKLGHEWYKHPALAKYEKGIRQVYDELDEFLLSQGYEHIRGTGKYKIVEKSEKRIAIFAHAGFGTAFMSCLFDIPFPLAALHFDMRTTGLTAIRFDNGKDGYSVPCVLSFANDGHLYAENLPTNIGNVIF